MAETAIIDARLRCDFCHVDRDFNGFRVGSAQHGHCNNWNHARLWIVSQSEGVATIDDPCGRNLSGQQPFSERRTIWTDVANQAGERFHSVQLGEGKRRKRERAFLNHLDIALGSQGEVEVQLEIAKRVGFLSKSEYERVQEIVEEVGRMLNGLIGSMQPLE